MIPMLFLKGKKKISFGIFLEVKDHTRMKGFSGNMIYRITSFQDYFMAQMLRDHLRVSYLVIDLRVNIEI